MHSSSNAGGAIVVANVAAGTMARLTFHCCKWAEYLAWILNAQRIQVHAELHLESRIAAFRVLALARSFWFLLCICACRAAMLLANAGLTVAAGTFAFLRGGCHFSSFPKMCSNS